MMQLERESWAAHLEEQLTGAELDTQLHLILPALNLSTLNAGILIMMQQVRFMMFLLNMLDYSIYFLSQST